MEQHRGHDGAEARRLLMGRMGLKGMKGSAKADLLAAFSILQPDADDHETRRAMARLLGLDWALAAAIVAAAPQAGAGVPAQRVAPSEMTGTTASATVGDAGSVAVAASPVDFSIIQTGKPGRKPPQWLEHATPMAPPGAAAPETAGSEYLPLFDPQWTRGILTLALSGTPAEGAVDFRRLIEIISRGEALKELPRDKVGSMARGVQVLSDIGPAMSPFARDIDWLETRLRKIAGEYAVQVLRFSGCPWTGAGPGSRRKWKPYREIPAPRTGTTVVALTDLGIARATPTDFPADPAEWLEFAEHLRTLGCPLLVITPFRESRWPRELRGRLTILHWDRRTTAANVRSLIRSRPR